MDPTKIHTFIQWIVGYVDDNYLSLTCREGGISWGSIYKGIRGIGILGGNPTIYWRGLGLKNIRIFSHGLEEGKGQGYLASIKNMPGTVAIKGNEGDSPINIKRIEAWEAEIMLGVRTGLSGQDEIELAYKMEDATILVRRIKQDSLTYFESEIVYREIWMATIKYCLPFTIFT